MEGAAEDGALVAYPALRLRPWCGLALRLTCIGAGVDNNSALKTNRVSSVVCQYTVCSLHGTARKSGMGCSFGADKLFGITLSVCNTVQCYGYGPVKAIME